QQGRYSCSGSSCNIAVPAPTEGPLVDLLPLFLSRTDPAVVTTTAAAERLNFSPVAAAAAAVPPKDADDVVCYCLRLGFLRQQAEATPGAAVPGIAAVEPAQQKQGWQAEGPQKEEQQLTASVGRCSCCCCSRCSEREVASLPFAPCLFDRPAATETLEQQQMEAAALTQDQRQEQQQQQQQKQTEALCKENHGLAVAVAMPAEIVAPCFVCAAVVPLLMRFWGSWRWTPQHLLQWTMAAAPEAIAATCPPPACSLAASAAAALAAAAADLRGAKGVSSCSSAVVQLYSTPSTTAGGKPAAGVDSACQWTEQTLHSHAAGAMSDAPATSERVRALNLDEAVQRLALLSSPLADSPTGDIAALNSMVEEQSKQNSQREPLNQWEHQPVLRETELVSSGARTSSTGQVSTSVAQSSISECHGERGRNYQCTAPEAEDLVASYFNHVRQLHEAHSFSDRVCSFGSTADCLDISSVCTVALRLLGADKKHQYCDMLTPTNHCYCSVNCSAEGNIFGVATQSTKPASIGLLKAILPLPEDVHVQRGKQQRHHRPGFACEYIGVTDVATGDTLTVSLLLTLLLPTQRMLLPWDIHWAPRTAGLSSTEGAAAETERLVCTAEPTRHSLPECMSRRSTACGVSPSNGGWCCGRTCICSCCNDNSSCADDASSEWQKASSVILSASPGDLGPTTEVFQLVSDVLGPLLLPAQQKQQHCKLMQQSVGAEVSGPQEPLRTPLAPQGGQGEESSASSTAGSSTVWARTVSGGVSLRVTSAEEASSSLESDSEGAPVSPFMQQERQQQGPLPSAGSLVLPHSLAAPQGDEGCGGPADCAINSSSSSSSSIVAGAEDSCGVMIDALRDLVGFVRIGAEVDVGFPISAELLEEAGEELHAICRANKQAMQSPNKWSFLLRLLYAVGATQSPLSPGTPSTDAGVTGAGSGGLTQQAQLLDVSLSLEAPDAAERCRATSLWSEGPGLQQQSELRLLPALFAGLYYTGATAKRRLFPRHRIVSAVAAGGPVSGSASPRSRNRKQQTLGAHHKQQQKPQQQAPLHCSAASLSSGQDGGLSDRSVLAGKTSSGSSLAPGGKTSGRSSNRSGNNTPTGVYFDAARQLWRCQWRSEGRLRSKGFAVSSEPASHPTAAASGAGTATWAQPIAVQQAAAKQSTAEERRLLDATISSSNSKGAVVSESVFAAPQFASTAVQPPLTTAAAVTQLQGERFLEVAAVGFLFGGCAAAATAADAAAAGTGRFGSKTQHQDELRQVASQRAIPGEGSAQAVGMATAKGGEQQQQGRTRILTLAPCILEGQNREDSGNTADQGDEGAAKRLRVAPDSV
ncbi:uncharacterized protein LOC34621519, partial [Cyclospora cayetanensis]|uniref:Uncharacterized protein LOC34621519 n=1 Tax=Cyclospora cayetanensis TaxID=88456 RepID=A0A6P6S1P8_9EIME